MQILGFGLAKPVNPSRFGMKDKVDAETSKRRKAWELELEQLQQAERLAKDTFTFNSNAVGLVVSDPPKSNNPAVKSTSAEPASTLEVLQDTQKLAAMLNRKVEAIQVAQVKHAQLQQQLSSSLEILAKRGMLGDYLKDPQNKQLL